MYLLPVLVLVGILHQSSASFFGGGGCGCAQPQQICAPPPPPIVCAPPPPPIPCPPPQPSKSFIILAAFIVSVCLPQPIAPVISCCSQCASPCRRRYYGRRRHVRDTEPETTIDPRCNSEQLRQIIRDVSGS